MCCLDGTFTLTLRVSRASSHSTPNARSTGKLSKSRLTFWMVGFLSSSGIDCRTSVELLVYFVSRKPPSHSRRISVCDIDTGSSSVSTDRSRSST